MDYPAERSFAAAPEMPSPELESAAFASTENGGVAASRLETMPRPASLSRAGEQLPFQGWDRYKIVSCLGSGGMGTVYKAQDPRLRRTVAIKFLRCGQLDALGSRPRRRFEREARAQASIDHPNICKIYEVGEVEGQPYIAMQLIAGSSLAGLHHVMTREQKVRAMKAVAEALHAAHLHGVIHRDIKPNEVVARFIVGEQALPAACGQFVDSLLSFGGRLAKGKRVPGFTSNPLQKPLPRKSCQ